jgi:hypothetical protein
MFCDSKTWFLRIQEFDSKTWQQINTFQEWIINLLPHHWILDVLFTETINVFPYHWTQDVRFTETINLLLWKLLTYIIPVASETVMFINSGVQ